MSAYLDTLQNLASAFLLGTCFYATISTVVILFRGRAAPPLQDRRRTSLILFLKLAAFWAKTAFLSFAMPSNNACQVTTVFSTLFDQAARTALAGFLVWTISHRLDTPLKQIGLWLFVGLRFALGVILAGLVRPQLANICVGRSSSAGYATSLLLIDGIILTGLLSRFLKQGIWADTRDVRSSTRKEQSKGLISLALGYFLWSVMSIPMILGLAQIPLFFRTGFPAIGVIVISVIINYFSGALALQRERRDGGPENKRGLSFDSATDSIERSLTGPYLTRYGFPGRGPQASISQIPPNSDLKELPGSFRNVDQSDASAPVARINIVTAGSSLQPMQNNHSAIQFLPELHFPTPIQEDWLCPRRYSTKTRDGTSGMVLRTIQSTDGSQRTIQASEGPAFDLMQPSLGRGGSDTGHKTGLEPTEISREDTESHAVDIVPRKALKAASTLQDAEITVDTASEASRPPLRQDQSWLRTSKISQESLEATQLENLTFYSHGDDLTPPLHFKGRSQCSSSSATSPSRLETSLHGLRSLETNSIRTRLPSPSRGLKRKQIGTSHCSPSGCPIPTGVSSATLVSACSEPRHASPGQLSPSPLLNPKPNRPPQSSPGIANEAVGEASLLARHLSAKSQKAVMPKFDPSLAIISPNTSRRRTLVVVDDLGNDEFFGNILVETDTLELLFPAPPTTLARPPQSTAPAPDSQDMNVASRVKNLSTTGSSKVVHLVACAPITLPDLVVDSGSSSNSRPSSAESARSVSGCRKLSLASSSGKLPKLNEVAASVSPNESHSKLRRPSVVCVEGKLSSTSGKESLLSNSLTGLLAVHSKQRNSMASTPSQKSREQIANNSSVDCDALRHSCETSIMDASEDTATPKDSDPVTEEIVTVMLDTEEASSIFWDTADDLRCFRIKPVTPLSKQRRKTMPWHYRIGDATPTFSGRKTPLESRRAPPPVPLQLGTRKIPAQSLGLNKPLPDESEAIREIQDQLRKFEQSSNVKVSPNLSDRILQPTDHHNTLVKSLDHEIGRQRKYWLDLHRNLNQDSSTTDDEGFDAPKTRKSLKKSCRPVSRFAEIRDKLESQSCTKPPIPGKSDRRASTQNAQNLRRSSLKEQSVHRGTKEKQHTPKGQRLLPAVSRRSTGQTKQSSQICDHLIMDANQGTNIKSSKCRSCNNSSVSAAESLEAIETLSTKVYKPITELWRPSKPDVQHSSSYLWTSKLTHGHHNPATVTTIISTRRHHRGKPSRDPPLTLSSTHMWTRKPTTRPVSNGLWGAFRDHTVPKAKQKPLRRNRRTTLLPDIIESPKPVPGREGVLGIFQWPWGASDSAQIQPMFPPPPPPPPVRVLPEFNTSFDSNEYEMALEDEMEYSSYFADCDLDGTSAEDEFDESGFWKLYSKVQCQTIPCKNDGFDSGIRIVEDYDDEQSADPDADSIYDSETLGDEHGWGYQDQSIDATQLYRLEDVELQHSPIAVA